MILQNFLMLLIITTLLVSGFARADSYSEAVVGHVVTQELTGEIDKGAVANAELNRQMHQLSLEILAVVFNNMPTILDGISAVSYTHLTLPTILLV